MVSDFGYLGLVTLVLFSSSTRVTLLTEGFCCYCLLTWLIFHQILRSGEGFQTRFFCPSAFSISVPQVQVLAISGCLCCGCETIAFDGKGRVDLLTEGFCCYCLLKWLIFHQILRSGEGFQTRFFCPSAFSISVPQVQVLAISGCLCCGCETIAFNGKGRVDSFLRCGWRKLVRVGC